MSVGTVEELRSALNTAYDEIQELNAEKDTLQRELDRARVEVAELRAEMDAPMLGGLR